MSQYHMGNDGVFPYSPAVTFSSCIMFFFSQHGFSFVLIFDLVSVMVSTILNDVEHIKGLKKPEIIKVQ